MWHIFFEFMKNTCEFEHITSPNNATDYLFDCIQKTWEFQGGTTNIIDIYKKKIFTENKYHIEAYLMLDENIPVGIAWVELTSSSYGNTSIFIIDGKYASNMVDFLIFIKTFQNRMIEIVSFQNNSDIKDNLYKKNLIANIRHRMSLWLNKDQVFDTDQKDFTFRPYTPQDINWAAQLSVQSHQISKDYHMYDEMNDLDKRTALEQRVWTGWYGDVIELASVVILQNNKPVGYCLIVDVACWGFDHVPWIFDICIDPAYHGQGIGKILSYHYLNKLTEMNYPLVGLAVTMSNVYAKSLYEKCGFQYIDTFYEFTQI